jgi:hypothetical protein
MTPFDNKGFFPAPSALTADRLRDMLDYEPSTGVFTWKERPIHRPRWDKAWNTRFAGSVAGTPNSCGYQTIAILPRKWLAHS